MREDLFGSYYSLFLLPRDPAVPNQLIPSSFVRLERANISSRRKDQRVIQDQLEPGWIGRICSFRYGILENCMFAVKASFSPITVILDR